METLTQEDEGRYRALCERIRTWHEEQDVPFDYPPATEEQVRETEVELGVPLPPLLRMLYTDVANGGYLLGPRFEFFGAVGGCQDSLDRTIGQLMNKNNWRFHPCMVQALERFPGYSVFADTCPEGFLTFSNQLGVTSVVCNLPTGAVYLTGLGPEIPTEDPGGKPGWLTEIKCMASSLEDCAIAMLEGTLYTRKQAGRSLSDEDFASYVESSCSEDARAVWRGLYRFSPGFFTPEEPDPEDWDVDESAFDLPDM